MRKCDCVPLTCQKPFSSPEPTIILTCGRDRELWPDSTSEHAQSIRLIFSANQICHIWPGESVNCGLPALDKARAWSQSSRSLPQVRMIVGSGDENGQKQIKDTGRVPFDQNFRKFRFKIEWNRNFPKIRFENFGSRSEVVLNLLFSGNLEIPEISCSIWHFYPVWIDPSSFSREKLQDGGEAFELHNTGCKIICHNSSLLLIENENVRIWFPGKLWTCRSEFPVGQFARFVYSPARKVRKFLS